MKPNPTRCRPALTGVLVVLLAVLALLAGCAAPTIAGHGGPGNGSTTTGPPTGQWDPPTGPPTGPAAGSTVVARWTDYPGFFCPVDRTLVAVVTVYSDGSVLLSDGIGASCAPIPWLTAWYVDLDGLHDLLTGYFDGPDAAVNMDHLPVSDLGGSQLTYFDRHGGEHVVSAYGLFFDDSNLRDVPADVKRARAALRAVSDAIGGLVGTESARWTPVTVVVVKGRADDTAADTAPWPLPMSDELSDLLGSDRGCLAVTGDAARTLWTAAGGREFAASTWTVDGSRYRLAVGAALPGSVPCERPS